ncbi:28S ribosomal protein S18c, mitochondrial [Anopheles maculipalpis]|uniref:28S ribosomal protein S18c, mitochondrial n=1 Tax=Anopheles maculipalpis TaxID=1496333 RepID=UPI0021599DB5|nr:28S ribosomal protein S18c, mitochondrial [Anopheles maculipalpis]
MLSSIGSRLRVGRVILGYINKEAFAPTAGRLSSPRNYTTSIDNNAPIELKENPFAKDKVQCVLCKHGISPDYKNVQLLSQFQSPYTGRVYGRHITGLCKDRHEQVEREIIKAQNAGLMPTYHKAVEFLNDPKLFDPEKAIRPHKY